MFNLDQMGAVRGTRFFVQKLEVNYMAIDPTTAKIIAQTALKVATDEEARKKVSRNQGP